MKRTILLLPLALLLVACGSGDKYQPKKQPDIKPVVLEPGNEATLMPFKVGNQWVYVAEIGAQKQEITFRVTDVRTEGDATIATLSTSSTGTQPRDSEWRIDPTGIYQVSDGPDRRFDPPQLIFPIPATLYELREMKSTGPTPGGEGAFDLAVKYLGPQEVDTEMGRMSALAVESVTSWTTPDGPARSIAVTWWVPGVGFVRQRQEIITQAGSGVIVMKLKSHSFT
jgi:hypothetical protein